MVAECQVVQAWMMVVVDKDGDGSAVTLLMTFCVRSTKNDDSAASQFHPCSLLITPIDLSVSTVMTAALIRTTTSLSP